MLGQEEADKSNRRTSGDPRGSALQSISRHEVRCQDNIAGKEITQSRTQLKQKAPFVSEWSLFILCRRRPTLPHTFACSTIGPAGLNCRVRDGNGCDPRGVVTDKINIARPATVTFCRHIRQVLRDIPGAAEAAGNQSREGLLRLPFERKRKAKIEAFSRLRRNAPGAGCRDHEPATRERELERQNLFFK